MKQCVKRVLINNGSSVDIIFTHCWERLDLEDKLEECMEQAPLGFGHNAVLVAGIARLPILFVTAPKQVFHRIKLYIVNTPSSYNMILGRPTLTLLRVITSITHLKIKFPTENGVGEIKGDTRASKYCYGSALNLAQTDPNNMRKAKMALRRREKRRRHLEYQQGQRKMTRDVQVVENMEDQMAEDLEQRMDATLKKCLQKDNELAVLPP